MNLKQVDKWLSINLHFVFRLLTVYGFDGKRNKCGKYPSFF
jgi:hypothetical protein